MVLMVMREALSVLNLAMPFSDFCFKIILVAVEKSYSVPRMKAERSVWKVVRNEANIEP